MPKPLSFDLAVIGAGIVGLGCALAGARQGKRVVVIDRDERANGASVRNFGFITVTGQARGEMWAHARRTRDVWAEVAPDAGIEVVHRGLFLAVRRPEAVSALEAFLKTEMGEGCLLLDPSEIRRRHPQMATPGLMGALWSPHELRVESRDAIPKLAWWLEQHHQVRFLRRTQALSVDAGKVITTGGPVLATGVAVCPGDDLTSLYPNNIARHGVTRCKLQMLRLADPGFRLPGGVMSDLGLVRYAGYAALPEARPLHARLRHEQPAHLDNGVHLIVVQSADGSLVVGDSHHYANTPDPFASEAVDALILEEFQAVFGRDAPQVLERWVGTYASATERTLLIDAPAPDVRLAMVTTGAGASTAFALGEAVIADLFGGPGREQ